MPHLQPIHSMLGYLSLLSGTPLTKQQAEYVAILTSAGQALLRLVTDVTDLSRYERMVGDVAAGAKLDVRTFRLRSALEDALLAVAPHVDQRNVRLNLLLDPRVPDIVAGDVGLFSKALLNVLSNGEGRTPWRGCSAHGGTADGGRGRRMVAATIVLSR